jgi:hypothetical protein
MRAFDPDDFDIHTAAQPYRDRPVGDQNLCAGCTHSHVYRRQGHEHAAVYCHSVGHYVPPDIVECSEFQAVAGLNLRQMQEIALPIDPRRGVSDGSYR